MNETEDQLRKMLRAHAADSEHLLDVVLAERAIAESHVINALRNHLSALREAVGRYLMAHVQYDAVAKHEHCDVKAVRYCSDQIAMAKSDLIREYGGAPAIVRAAHDAAPAAPALTLEEVQDVLANVLGLGPVHCAEVDSALRERLAQKGAGNG